MPSGHPPGIPQLSSATLLNASMRRNTSLCQSPGRSEWPRSKATTVRCSHPGLGDPG